MLIADCYMYLYIYWYNSFSLFVVYIVYSMLYSHTNNSILYGISMRRYDNYYYFLPLSSPYCCWSLYMVVLVRTRNDNNGLVYVDLDDDDMYVGCNKFYVFSDWNNTNGNTTISIFSFSTAATVVFAYLWVRRVYST